MKVIFLKSIKERLPDFKSAIQITQRDFDHLVSFLSLSDIPIKQPRFWERGDYEKKILSRAAESPNVLLVFQNILGRYLFLDVGGQSILISDFDFEEDLDKIKERHKNNLLRGIKSMIG